MKGLDYFRIGLSRKLQSFLKWKPWKPRLGDGGVTKLHKITIINITLFISIGGVNLIDQISKNQSLIERWDKTFLFLLMAFFCYLFRNKIKFYGYLYAMMSVLALLTTREEANLTGLVFLMYSLYMFRTYFLSAIITLSTFILIGTKVFLGFSANQILVLVLGYAYCLIIYYILIHPKSDNKIIVICPELDAETIKILQKLYLGFSVKDISDMVYLTQDAVSKRIGRARQTMGAKNTIHLLAICQKKGYIRYNMDNQAKAL